MLIRAMWRVLAISSKLNPRISSMMRTHKEVAMSKLRLVSSLIAICAVGGFAAYSFMKAPPLTESSGTVYNVIDKDKNVVGTYTIPSDVEILNEPNAD